MADYTAREALARELEEAINHLIDLPLAQQTERDNRIVEVVAKAIEQLRADDAREANCG